MKFAELKFEQHGCCGQDHVATVQNGDRSLKIYKDENLYRIITVCGGSLVGKVVRAAAEADVQDRIDKFLA